MASPFEALRVLEQTSRTFFIPISRLPSPLQEAVISAYLCMRALDEIEDHPHLDRQVKVKLLQALSQALQCQAGHSIVSLDAKTHAFTTQSTLPEVTLRLGEWVSYAPEAIAPRIWDATAAMADRMAFWVSKNWKISNEADLDSYTFAVAGTVGLLLCDLWAWFDGLQMYRNCAVTFGRGLQVVNILRNREEDLARGVDFFPTGWTQKQMWQYAQLNLLQTERYANTLPPSPFASLIQLPLSLAYATLDALARGETKLSRQEVEQFVQHLDLVERPERD